jgi:hypothetical protein
VARATRCGGRDTVDSVTTSSRVGQDANLTISDASIPGSDDANPNSLETIMDAETLDGDEAF